MKDKEIRELVRKAFQESQFRWRTPRGIAKETKLPLNQVAEFLDRSGEARKAKKGNRQGEPLYTLKGEYEIRRPFIQRLIYKIANKE